MFITLDNMHRTLKCDDSLNTVVVLYCGAVCFYPDFTEIVILENLSILDLQRSGVKGFMPKAKRFCEEEMRKCDRELPLYWK